MDGPTLVSPTSVCVRDRECRCGEDMRHRFVGCRGRGKCSSCGSSLSCQGWLLVAEPVSETWFLFLERGRGGALRGFSRMSFVLVQIYVLYLTLHSPPTPPPSPHLSLTTIHRSSTSASTASTSTASCLPASSTSSWSTTRR